MFDKKRIPNLLFVLFLIGLFIKIVLQIYHNIKFENGYTLGDWLIMYEDGGFKRRGLSGSMALFFYNFLGVPIKHFLFAFQSFLYATFFFFLIKISLSRPIPFQLLLLSFLPCTLGFWNIDVGSIGRKEILILALFTYFINRYQSLKFTTIYHLFLPIFFLYPVVALFHELALFCFPFFFLPVLLGTQKFSLNSKIIALSYFVLISLGIIGSIHFLGTNINNGNTFKILEEAGISGNLKNLGHHGMLTWPDTFDPIAYNIRNHHETYLISLFLGILAFFLTIKNLEFYFSIRYFLILCAFTFAGLLPLFIKSIDWGRWLFLFFTMTLVYLLSAYVGHNKNWNSKKSIFLVFFLLILILFWRFDLVDHGFYLSIFKF